MPRSWPGTPAPRPCVYLAMMAALAAGCEGQAVDDLQTELDALQAEVDALDASHQTLEGLVAALSGGSTAPVDLTALEGRVTAVEAAAATNAADITSNTSSVGTVSGDLTALAVRVATLEAIAGNESWSWSGSTQQILGPSLAEVSGSALSVTTSKHAPLLVLAAVDTVGMGTGGGWISGYEFQIVAEQSGGSWTAAGPAVGFKVGVENDEGGAIMALFNVPAAGTYRLALHGSQSGSGGAALNGFDLVAIQLAPGL